MSPGESLEYRIAKLVFNQDYFTRRHVSVRHLFYPDKIDVTDIDVLGIKFDYNLNKTVSIWECKSGQNNRPVDRILWLLGMSNYIGANYKSILLPNVSDKIKSFGGSIGVSVWSEELVTIEEKLFDDSFAGSNNAIRYHQRHFDNYKIIRNDPKFSRIYWFQNSDFWLTNPASRLKKVISCIRDCQDTDLGSNERRQVKFDLLMESTVLLSVALLDFARTMYAWHGNGLNEQITLAMRSGDREDKKELVKATFEYLNQFKGRLPTNTQELLEIPPPPYNEALINNIERIFEHPCIAVEVPRFLEILVYDYIIPQSNPERRELESFFRSDITLLAKLSKNVINFLERATGFPKELMEPLMKL